MAKLVLTCLAALLYAIGWTFGIVAMGLLWCWSAMAVGWDDARRKPSRVP